MMSITTDHNAGHLSDFLGKELAMNDLIIMKNPKDSGMLVAKVVSFTIDKALVSFTDTWDFGGSGIAVTRFLLPNQIIKMSDDDAVLYKLSHL